MALRSCFSLARSTLIHRPSPILPSSFALTRPFSLSSCKFESNKNDSLLDTVQSAASSAKDTLVDAAHSVQEATKSASSSVTDQVKDLTEGLEESAKKAGEEAVDTVKDAVPAAKEESIPSPTSDESILASPSSDSQPKSTKKNLKDVTERTISQVPKGSVNFKDIERMAQMHAKLHEELVPSSKVTLISTSPAQPSVSASASPSATASSPSSPSSTSSLTFSTPAPYPSSSYLPAPSSPRRPKPISHNKKVYPRGPKTRLTGRKREALERRGTPWAVTKEEVQLRRKRMFD